MWTCEPTLDMYFSSIIMRQNVVVVFRFTDFLHSYSQFATFRVKHNNPWTLFVRNYRVENAEACQDLDLDKTNNVGGYKIRFSERSIKDLFRIKRNKKNCRIYFDGFRGVIFDTFLRYIKATSRMILLPEQHRDGTLITEINDNIIQEYFTTKPIDLMEHQRHMALEGNVSHVDSFMQSGLRAITQFSGRESTLSKIRCILSLLGQCSFFKYC